METNSNISPRTQQLAKLFSSVKNAKITPWENSDKAVGLSVLKDYPDKGKFIPVRNKKGEKDSVAMVRVYYYKSDFNDQTTNIVPLFVSIHKANRYLFDHPFWNFNDDNSPTEESLEESKKSLQPIDLEELSRYEFHFDDDKIYDLKKKKNISPTEIVDEIYKEHLNTLKNSPFRVKMWAQKKAVEIIDPINSFLIKTNYYLFGKKIKKGNDLGVGIYKPYSFKDLDDLTLTSERSKILGSDFPISYQTAGTFVVIFSVLYLVSYYFHKDFGIVALINSTTNSFFLAVLTATMLLIVDRVFPYAILLIINLLIRFRLYLMFLKIRT